MREAAAGDVLDQYTLTELIARSGMASIFKAVDSADGATVALKIPHLQYESDVVFFERFQREEQIGQRLEHPGIIKVLIPGEKSRMYLAMEFVEGRTLRAVLAEARGPLPVPRALAIAIQLCEALAYLHERGVVHRDLKPENIHVTPDGSVKILDFGIALDKQARRITWTGLSSTIGTPDYMAPEQIGGRRGDARTDVYAVGTMLFELLTGQLPFAESDAFALMRAKTSDEPKLPSYYQPVIDRSLEAIVMRAIQRNPRDRYQKIADLLADLKNPGAVAPFDPLAVRRASGVRLHSRFKVPLAVTAILAGLAALVWLSSRGAPPSQQQAPGARRER